MIRFMWIPSHIGIHENKEADVQARLAVISDISDLEENCVASDLEVFFENKLVYLWQQDRNRSLSKLSEFKNMCYH